MSETKILITEAGLAEIRNAEASGTAPVVLSHIAFGTGQYTATSNLTALKSEFKRFESVKGGAIGDNIVHLTLHDNSSDTYTVYEVGVFTGSGTLFAVYSQTTPIIQKAKDAEAMLAIDIAFEDIDVESITVGDTNIILNPATTEKAGVVELATEAEAKAGTDTSRAITPKTLDATIEAHDNIVHRDGFEVITGSKYFNNNLLVLKSTNIDPDVAPNSSIFCNYALYDKNSNWIGALGSSHSSDDKIYTRMATARLINGTVKWGAEIKCVIEPDGTTYTVAPTPDTGDNSTKIATTAFVNTKASNYLPLAGGEMTGAITVKSGTAMRKNDEKSCVQICGGSDSSSATLWLCGKEFSDSAFGQNAEGGFVLRAATSSDDYIHLLGLPDGELSWNGQNIVRSVNGTNADANGNVSITSVASATKATQDGNGKVIADTYVSLTGNQTVAGNKNFTGTLTYNNQDVLTKSYNSKNSNGLISITAGTGIATYDGAKLTLNGGTMSGDAGYFKIGAYSNGIGKELKGTPDGSLTWDAKYVLNNSFLMPNDNGAVMLTAGTSSTGGAYFRLYGKDNSSGAGQFVLATTDGTNTKAFTGKPDGSLTWNGKPIVVLEEAGEGYMKFSNGVMIQWGVSTSNPIIFPQPFKDTNYSITYLSYAQVSDRTFSIDNGKKTTTSVSIYLWVTGSSWQAIGKWK